MTLSLKIPGVADEICSDYEQTSSVQSTNMTPTCTLCPTNTSCTATNIVIASNISKMTLACEFPPVWIEIEYGGGTFDSVTSAPIGPVEREGERSLATTFKDPKLQDPKIGFDHVLAQPGTSVKCPRKN